MLEGWLEPNKDPCGFEPNIDELLTWYQHTSACFSEWTRLENAMARGVTRCDLCVTLRSALRVGIRAADTISAGALKESLSQRSRNLVVTFSEFHDWYLGCRWIEVWQHPSAPQLT